jgi:hypothetical protein
MPHLSHQDTKMSAKPTDTNPDTPPAASVTNAGKTPSAKPKPLNCGEHHWTPAKGATTLPAMLRELATIMAADLPIAEKLAHVEEARLASIVAVKLSKRSRSRGRGWHHANGPL